MLTRRQMAVSTGYCVCPKGACWCGRSAGGSPSPGCWSQCRCRGYAGCSSSIAAAMTPGLEGDGTGREQPSGLEILGCLAGHTVEVQCQLGGARWNIAGVTSGLSTNRAVNEPTRVWEDSVAGKERALYKEKAQVGAFPGHCETSRRFVDGSTFFSNQP